MSIPIGFLFQAQDKGVKKTLGEIQSGFDTITDSQSQLQDELRDTARESEKTAKTLKEAFEDFKRSDFVSGAKSLLGDMQAVGDFQASNLERLRLDSKKTLRQVVAGLDMSTQEADKFASRIYRVSERLGIGHDSLANMFAAAEQNSLDLFKTEKDMEKWARVLEVTGIDANEFANTLGTWTNEFGIAEKELQPLLGDMLVMGKRAGIGMEALQSMGQVTNRLAPIMRETLAKKGPEAVKTMLRSTVALGGALQKTLGGSAQENMEAAVSLTEKLASAQLDWNRMFAGAGDFPAFLKDTAVNVGSVEEAMALVNDDAAGFMIGLRQSMGQLTEAQRREAQPFFQRMAMQLGEVDSRLAGMFTSTKDVGAFFEQMGDPTGAVEGSSKAIDDLAKQSFVIGRTAEEEVARSFEHLEQAARDAAGPKVQELYRTLNKDMNDLAAAARDVNHPLRDKVELMGMISRLGPEVGAALQFMGPEAASKMVLAKEMKKQIDPTLTMLSNLKEMLFSVAAVKLIATGGGVEGAAAAGSLPALKGWLAGLGGGSAATAFMGIIAALGGGVAAGRFLGELGLDEMTSDMLMRMFSPKAFKAERAAEEEVHRGQIRKQLMETGLTEAETEPIIEEMMKDVRRYKKQVEKTGDRKSMMGTFTAPGGQEVKIRVYADEGTLATSEVGNQG